MIPLIDVSQHQGAIDFTVIRDAGVQAVYIRVLNASRRDTRAEFNMQAARDAGLLRGAYSFCNPKNSLSGAGQGRLLAQAHDIYQCELPPMWDVELYVNEAGPLPVLKGAPAARWQADFVTWCDGDSGRESIGYTGASFWNANLCPPVPSLFTDEWHADLMWLYQHDFILARYPGQHIVAGQPVDLLPRGVPPSGWEQVALGTGKFPPPLRFADKSWDGWQWSAGGNAQGPVYGTHSSDLDLNIITVQAFNRWVGAPTPIPGDDDMADIRLMKPSGTDAQFIALCGGPKDATGHSSVAVRCEWTGDGANPKVQARVAAHQAAGMTDLTAITVHDLINVSLDGPLPPGMTADQFANTDEINAREAPPSAVDQVARDAAAHANAGVDNIDRRLAAASEALVT